MPGEKLAGCLKMNWGDLRCFMYGKPFLVLAKVGTADIVRILTIPGARSKAGDHAGAYVEFPVRFRG